ncbi:MAG: 23S rRNA (uracil(1939)-C(5))-methyltransferase RlmD [Parasporobacterium sp.]|nr:23S rRNA (uracil(1939)-C(5))-methyltransferase RlmD [Parasporobacterium sp.]
MKKNDIIELKITDIGVNGEGIGKYEGCTFFVKDALSGDEVKAVVTKMKKDYGYAKMLEILKPSPGRVPPFCENARRCGGCQIMELKYSEQLRLKERKVRNNLEKIGGFKNPEILPIIGMSEEDCRILDPLSDNPDCVPTRYRNKMQFPIGRDRDGNLAAGFYAGRTHSIINTEDCSIAPEPLNRILHGVKAFLKEYKIPVYNEQTGQGLVRHLVLRMGFRTGEIMVCLVINGESLNDNNYSHNVDYESAFVDKLRNLPLFCGCKVHKPLKIESICVNINRENTNVILGKEIRCIYGRPFIYDEIVNKEDESRLRYKISPLSFYQVNPVQTEKLYAKALEFAGLSGNETVWDLYCGTGTISLFLARKAKQVMGVEIVPEAIRDAKENAAQNGIENAIFFCGKSEEIFPEYIKMLKKTISNESPETAIPGPSAAFDSAEEQNTVAVPVPPEEQDTVVVLDPPRKGCDRKLLDAILEAAPEKIVYVSCDSATLARDLKILTDPENQNSRYLIQKIQPLDMFPNSVHVETVCLLSNRKPDARVKIDVDLEDYYRIKDEQKKNKASE